MSPKPMLSPAQCAVRLGYTSATVIRLIKSGELPAAKVGRWRIDPDDLEAFIAKKKSAVSSPVIAVPCDVPAHPRFA